MARGHNVVTLEFITQANDAIKDTNKLTKTVDRLNKKIDGFNKKANEFKNFSNSLKRLQNLFLGMGLAALFGGMAIKNAAQQAIKGFTKVWTTVMDGSTAYNQSLGRLTASFQFLKFSIADAFLTSELGQSLIDVLISAMDWISSLSPATQKWIGYSLIIAFIFGMILMIVGQVALGFLGIIALATWLAVPLGIAALSTGLILLFVGLIVLGIFLLIGGLIAMALGQKTVAKWFFIIAAIVFGILLILAIIFAAPMLGIIAFIGLVIALGLAFMNASDDFKLSFLKVISVISKAMFESLIFPIRGLLLMASAIPGAAGKTASKAIAMLDRIKSKVGFEGTIADLEAKIAARQAEQAEAPVEEKSFTEKIKEKGSEIQEGVTNTFNIDTLNVEGTEASNLGEGITEAGQYNSSAGTG